MKAGLLLRLAHLEMREFPPDLEPAFPAPPAWWWKEFVSVCEVLPEGTDVLRVLELTADDIETLLVQEMGGDDAS